ncbi:hypothetical protein VP01_1069g1, partial [Puccinia sorghi]
LAIYILNLDHYKFTSAEIPIFDYKRLRFSPGLKKKKKKDQCLRLRMLQMTSRTSHNGRGTNIEMLEFYMTLGALLVIKWNCILLVHSFMELSAELRSFFKQWVGLIRWTRKDVVLYFPIDKCMTKHQFQLPTDSTQEEVHQLCFPSSESKRFYFQNFWRRKIHFHIQEIITTRNSKNNVNSERLAQKNKSTVIQCWWRYIAGSCLGIFAVSSSSAFLILEGFWGIPSQPLPLPEKCKRVIHQVRGEDIQAKVMILLSWSQNWIFVVNELFSIEEQKHFSKFGPKSILSLSHIKLAAFWGKISVKRYSRPSMTLPQFNQQVDQNFQPPDLTTMFQSFLGRKCLFNHNFWNSTKIYLITQELIQAIFWETNIYSLIKGYIHYIQESAEHLANDPKVEKDNIDQVRLGDCGQEEKLCLINKDSGLWMIFGELSPYALQWATQLKEVRAYDKNGNGSSQKAAQAKLDDGEVEVVIKGRMNDGEDVDGGAISSEVDDVEAAIA